MRQLFRLILSAMLLIFLTNASAKDLKEIEQEFSDSVITTKVTAKITKNKNLNPLKISVATEDGIVKLSGSVKDNQAFFDVLRLTIATKGVKSVNTDHLLVRRVNTIFTDAYITAKVETAILKAKILDDESIPLIGINAKTINGIVTLSGEVNHNASIISIVNRVNQVNGVKKIISTLHATNS